MKKAFFCITIVLIACLSITGCKITKDGTPDEWRIFGNDNERSLSDYHIDYLKLSRYSTTYATIYGCDDMTALFDMVNKLVLTKSHESNDLPADFDLLCTVSFVHEDKERYDLSYYFQLSTTSEICFIKSRLAAVGVGYVGSSTEILNEVNRLIELYNQK